MKERLARACLLLLSCSAAAGGAVVFWIHPVAFAVDSSSLYGLCVGPLLAAILGGIACFAPFDNPKSASRWASTLAGLSAGVGLGGLALFTPSFLVLAPVLGLYAWGLHASGRIIAATASAPKAPEPEPEETGDPSDPFSFGTTFLAAQALDDSDETAESTRGVKAILIGFAILGVGICWSWRPAPGAKPQPLSAEVPAVVAPPTPHLVAKRIRRPQTDLLELSGKRVHVQISLQRPRVVLQLREHNLIIEPCLLIERGSVDGFFAIDPLNAYTLEPGGLALAEFVEGPRHGWARIEYRTGRFSTPDPSLGRATAALGRRARAGDISAVIDLELDFETGRLTLDAVTRLTKPAAVQMATVGYLRLKDPGQGPVEVGLGGEVIPLPGLQREEGQWRQPVSLVAQGDDLARLLRAKRGEQGPYETLELGRFGGWLTLPGQHEPLLVVAPDWASQASTQPSRAAGHGLPENGLMAWSEAGGVNVVLDLAGTRIGPSPIATELPPGLYRNRLVIRALDGLDAPSAALHELERIGAPPPGLEDKSTSVRGTPDPG